MHILNPEHFLLVFILYKTALHFVNCNGKVSTDLEQYLGKV